MFRSSLIFPMLAIVAAPAAAATYSAKLAAPAYSHIVAHEMNWACAGDSCEGATKESRPAVLCEGLAKRAGKVNSFLVDGRAFTATELDKCNAGLRPSPTQTAAAH